MFRSSLTIIRPVCESCFTNAGYILGSHYVYNFASVYTCYVNLYIYITGVHTGKVVNIVGSQYVASICKTRFTNGPDDGQ